MRGRGLCRDLYFFHKPEDVLHKEEVVRICTVWYRYASNCRQSSFFRLLSKFNSENRTFSIDKSKFQTYNKNKKSEIRIGNRKATPQKVALPSGW